MKKCSLFLAVLVSLFAVPAFAASDSLVLKVTPQGVKGVAIDATQYDFGAQALGAQNVLSTADINVQNTGTIASSWLINVAPTSTVWTPGTSSGVDQYHLSAIFNSVQPVAGDFTNGADDVLATQKPANSTDFAGDQTGQNVPPSASRKLWLALDMPSTSSSENEQWFSFVVTTN